MSFWRVKNKPPVFRTCLEGYEITSRLAVRSLWMNCQSGTPVLRIPVLPIALCHLSFVVIKTWTGAQTNTNANIYQPLVQQNLEELSWGTLMNKNHEETRKELPYEPRTCLGHLRNNLCLPFQVCYMRLFQQMTKNYESAIWSNTIPLYTLYTCLNMTYLNLYGYPRPLVNEPIDLPSLRLAAWYFENHWSSTISPCDPGSPPQGSTVAVDPSSTGLSGTKRPLLWMVAVFLSSKIHMVNWNWGGYIASVVKAWKSWTRNSSICSQAL